MPMHRPTRLPYRGRLTREGGPRLIIWKLDALAEMDKDADVERFLEESRTFFTPEECDAAERVLRVLVRKGERFA
jgi:hypothetical protein